MKKIYLLALISTCISLSLSANGVEINGIHYLLDSTNYTASVTYTGSSAYSNNSYTGEVVIPASIGYNNHAYSVTSIGDHAFYSCSGLTSITIPNSIICIGGYAFCGCNNLTAVTIPNSVTSIEDEVFNNCNGLVSPVYNAHIFVYMPTFFTGAYTILDGIKSIAGGAFSECSGLTAITIPNSVTSIGVNAFWGCSGLTAVTIPNNVVSIGFQAFSYCSGLTSVTIGNSVKSIGNLAFSYCSGLTSLMIGNSVTSVGGGAFSSCSSLTSVTIPSNVASIGLQAFSRCSSLASIKVEAGNATYDSRDNCNAIIKTISNTLIAGCQNTIIPPSVTSIGVSAFEGCSNLTSIEIPNSVINIETYAFEVCNGLTSITMPNSVTSIGNNAFDGCSQLDTVICKANTPPTLGSSVFYNISPTAVLLVPYESIDAYKAVSGYADSFAEIKGFSDVEDITDTTATLKWIPDTAVVQYDINVYTADTLFAHYVVDGNGQIVSSQRFTPSIYKQKLDTTTSSTDYFVITLDGLDSGTDYTYTIDGIDAQSAPIYHEEGAFTTMNEGEEGLFDAIADDPRKAGKFLRDGLLLIKKNDRTYNAQGVEIQTQNQ